MSPPAGAPSPGADLLVTPPPLPRAASGRRPAVVAKIPAKAVTGIFLILLMVVLYVGKALVLPVIIAVLLSFLFAPYVRWLADIGLPRVLGAMLVLGLAGGVIGVGVYELSTPAAAWMERLPQALTKVQSKLHALKHPVDRMNEAAKQVETMTATKDPDHPTVSVAQPSTLGSHLMSSTGEFLAGLVITVIALFFLLASGGAILERVVALIPALSRDHDPDKMLLGIQPEVDSTMVLRDSERLVSMFLRTTILINTCLAAALSGGFWAAGLPNPLLWGVVAGVLNFLPYVGPIIGIPVVALASLVSFDSLQQALVPPLIYAGCAFVEGNMITPFVLGRRLAMSPIAIFLWMALWAFMWGPAGALIAVPMLVMTKEFCSRIEHLKGVARVIEH